MGFSWLLCLHSRGGDIIGSINPETLADGQAGIAALAMGSRGVLAKHQASAYFSNFDPDAN